MNGRTLAALGVLLTSLGCSGGDETDGPPDPSSDPGPFRLSGHWLCSTGDRDFSAGHAVDLSLPAVENDLAPSGSFRGEWRPWSTRTPGGWVAGSWGGGTIGIQEVDGPLQWTPTSELHTGPYTPGASRFSVTVVNGGSFMGMLLPAGGALTCDRL